MNFRRVSFRSRRSYHGSLRLLSLKFHRGIRRKLLCLALVLSLLSMPGFDVALRQAPVLASSTVNSAASSFRSLSTLLEWLFGTKAVAAPVRQETLADRTNRVSKIRVVPAKLVAYIGDTHTFTAVGAGAGGEVLHGVRFNWTSNQAKPQIDEAGRATFLQPGQYTVTASAGRAQGSATVLVRPTSRPRQS